MEGRARSAERALETAVFGAWQGARFANLKKLKPLKVYLAELKPKKPQGSSDMLAAMQELQARGAAVTIKRVD